MLQWYIIPVSTQTFSNNLRFQEKHTSEKFRPQQSLPTPNINIFCLQEQDGPRAYINDLMNKWVSLGLFLTPLSGVISPTYHW